MKRFIYHVPVKQILVCGIFSDTAEDARAQLDAGACEHICTLSGTTPSGDIELVTIQDLPNEGDNKGDGQ